MRLEVPAVTRQVLARFAAASGDSNPLHTDPEVARAAGFDDVIAHGMLTMAWLGRLVTSVRSQSELESFSVRFTAVTPVGGTPVFTCERDTPSRPGGSTWTLRGELEDGTVTVIGTATTRG